MKPTNPALIVMNATVTALALLVLATGTVAAHPHAYVTALDNVVLYDGGGLGLSVGGVRFDAWEASPNEVGQNTITLNDEVFSPASGRYCQDWNGNALCGEAGEPSHVFCSSLTLTDGLDWDPSRPVYVLVNGPVWGNPAFSECGLTYSGGTAGNVAHT